MRFLISIAMLFFLLLPAAAELEPVKINKLFYTNHADTDYKPIKLEASLTEPIELSLESILAQAIENNISLNIARRDSNIAKWGFWRRIADALPDLSLNASKVNRDGTFYLNSQFQTSIDETISSAGMRLNYRAFDGGTTTFLAVAERYYKNATKLTEKSTYNQVVYDSVRLYYELLRNQISLYTREKALKNSSANLELTRKFFEAGTGTKFDMFQAKANLAESQNQLINQEAEFRNAELELASHLNVDLATPYISDRSYISELVLIDQDIDPQEVIETAMEHNPQIQSLLAVRRGALHEGLSTGGDFLPKLDIYYDLTGTGEEFSDLFSIHTFGIDARYDIGDGLGLNALTNVLSAKNTVKKARLQYKQQLLGIEQSLRSSFIDFQRNKSAVDASRTRLKAAKEALRLSRLRYKNGIEIFNDLLSREQDFIEAENDLIDRITDYNLAQVNILFLMGKIDSTSVLQAHNNG